MPSAKRIRIFAGPNGSGKSTLFEEFKKNFDPGQFVNSDWIEKELSTYGFIDPANFNLQLTQEDLEAFCKTKDAQKLIQKSKGIGQEIDIYINNNVIVNKPKNTHSYEAALLTSFLRKKLIESGQSFSFETVMSHPSKLNELKEAIENGYKVYLYFVCLDDADLNLSRVQNRVEKGGHNVSADKIKSRYTRTLKNLLPALLLSYRAYLFDNSNTMELIAESNKGVMTIHKEGDELPNWFVRHVINKL